MKDDNCANFYFFSKRQAKTFKNQFQFSFWKKKKKRGKEEGQKNEGTAVLSF